MNRRREERAYLTRGPTCASPSRSSHAPATAGSVARRGWWKLCTPTDNEVAAIVERVFRRVVRKLGAGTCNRCASSCVENGQEDTHGQHSHSLDLSRSQARWRWY